MYFSLRTNTEETRREAPKIVESIKKTFGEEHIVDIRAYGNFVIVELRKLQAYVSYRYILGGGFKYRLYIYDPEQKEKNVSIDIEFIETIYSLQ